MTDGTPSEGDQDEAAFSNLLTLLDMEPLLAAPQRLGSEIIDYRKGFEEVNPAGLSTWTAGTDWSSRLPAVALR